MSSRSNTRRKQLLDLRSLDESGSTVTPPPPPPPAAAAAAPSPMGEAIGLAGGYLTRELWSQFMRGLGGNYIEFENLITLRDADLLTEEEFIALAVLLPSEMTAAN